MAVLKRVTEDTPRPFPEIIPEVPVWICELIGHLHAKELPMISASWFDDIRPFRAGVGEAGIAEVVAGLQSLRQSAIAKIRMSFIDTMIEERSTCNRPATIMALPNPSRNPIRLSASSLYVL